MRSDYRIGIVALSLFIGPALMATPAVSASFDKEAHFGGTPKPMGPWFNRHVQYFLNDFEAVGYVSGPGYNGRIDYRY
jgi:hypothetical protein